MINGTAENTPPGSSGAGDLSPGQVPATDTARLDAPPPVDPAEAAAPWAGPGSPSVFAEGSRPSRLAGFLEIILVSGIFTDFLVAASLAAVFRVPVRSLTQNPVLLFAVMMTSTVFIVFIAWALQWVHRDDPRLILPFSPRRGLLRETGLALALLPGLLVLMVVLKVVFTLVLPRAVLPTNALLDTIRVPQDLALFLVSSVVAGGVREEVQRAFIVLRGEVFFRAPMITLLAWSLVFGLEHRVQGWDAVFSTAVLGFVFGVIFLRRRNLYAPILCHALFNVTVLLLYWFTRPSGIGRA